MSEPEKQEEGFAEVINGNTEAGTGVPVTYVPSLSMDSLQSPTLYVSPMEGPEQAVLFEENLLVVINDPVCAMSITEQNSVVRIG